ncbi:hypothetical protein [Sulfurovum sp. NBC37-1]|uniref:hypothetical protein n=1 Tax=Sulfurovum sp. (strain NBC37-1) TaxID=387093 RepID=UPI000158769C|nr:hypothetical protein [Sulfurovum sp. NBC37-1]BAF71893.1 hypothetical protein SUN_0935 [Sulfurovum sp. NBC37-1]
MNILASKKIVILSMTATLIMAFVVMVIVDPMIDGKDGFGVIALQLSFFINKAKEIVSSWDVEAFRHLIVFDYIYAFSYMIFFASLISWLEKEKAQPTSIFPYVAIGAGVFDWIENSLELWFLNDVNAFSPTLFFIHSIFATLKWLALPVIVWMIIRLFRIKREQNV